MLPCVDQTPPAGGGAAPRRANSEVGELGCCWGSWARATLRVKYSLLVHRCRRATIAAKVITTATTTGVTAARLQLHHQGCWWGSWARVTLRMSTHCSCTDHHRHNHRRHRRPSLTPSPGVLVGILGQGDLADEYSLFVHRCRCATIAAKVITTTTTTGVTAARLQLHHHHLRRQRTSIALT